MHFGRRIGDLCNSCFAGDLSLLEVVRVGVVDPACILIRTTTLISPHSQIVAELVLVKIRPRVVFAVATKCHRLPTGSIYPQAFYTSCLHWLYSTSVQQRRSWFLPCRSLQFPSLPGKTHFSSVSSQVFFFFRKHCMSWVISSAVCTSNFFQAIFLHMTQVLFTAFGTCVIFYWLPRGVHIFGIWSTSEELGCNARLFQNNSRSSPSWEYGAD